MQGTQIKIGTLILGFFLQLLFGLALPPIFAAPRLTVCQNTEQLGLYHQCEEVRLLKSLPERVRVYQMSKKKVSTSLKQNFFRLDHLRPQQLVQNGQKVFVPSHLFSGKSSSRFWTLCEVRTSNTETKSIKVFCGGGKVQTVRAKDIYSASIPAAIQQEAQKSGSSAEDKALSLLKEKP